MIKKALIKIKKYRSRLKAFTLVEILVILALLGILIILSVVNASAQVQKARDAVRKGNIDRIKKVVEEYQQDANCYPIALPVCGNDLMSGNFKLLDDIPCDPKTKFSYVYVSEISACPSWFQIYGTLEYTADSIIDQIGCRDGCGPDCQFNYGAASSNQKLNPYCDVSTPESSPIGSPEPEGPPIQYVCAPGGSCENFIDPVLSGCPDIYPNDPTCQNQCVEKQKRCHDARSKQ